MAVRFVTRLAGDRLAVRLAVDLRGADFLAVDFRAGARLAADFFRPVDFRAADFRAGERFAVRLAVDFLAAALRPLVFRAGERFAVRLAVDFLAVDFRAGARLAADFFLAVDFRAGAFFTAFLAEDFLAAVLRAGDFLAVRLVGALLTAIDGSSLELNADLNAEPVANRTAFDAGIGTTAPVLGLRPTRGPRLTGWNVPNPTTVTFRPDRTSAMIVSNRTSNASPTDLRVDSVDALTVLTSSDLFTIISSVIRNSY